MKKQFSYADSLNIPFVAIIGDEELKKGVLNLKNMRTGEQLMLVGFEELLEILGSV
jgi:histidyl-tRNA synthetase